MDNTKFTSFDLSLELAQTKCTVESKYFWIRDGKDDWELVNKDNWEMVDGEWGGCRSIVPNYSQCDCYDCENNREYPCEKWNSCKQVQGIATYDILNDICIKHVDTFFNGMDQNSKWQVTHKIFDSLYYEHNKEEAETIIRKNIQLPISN